MLINHVNPQIPSRIIPSIVLLFFFTFKVCAQPEAIFTVYFGSDEDRITKGARKTILEQTTPILNPEEYRVNLIGHTDKKGNLAYNQALSERRAAKVKEELIGLGFPTEAIKSEGQAFLAPLTASESEEGFAKNRRVEVIIEKAHWNVESNYYSIPVDQAVELEYERSGTKIQIPKNAFRYPDGSPVEGEVVIQYREFRDVADFVVSNIPMQLEYEGEAAYFSSSGMFEIQAYDQSGQKLTLQSNKSLGVDFVQTQIQEVTQAWQFDETLQQWTLAEDKLKFDQTALKKVPKKDEPKLVGSFGQDWPGPSYWLTHDDTIQSLQAAFQKLPVIVAEAKKKNGYLPQLDFRTFHERYTIPAYSGTHYTGHLKGRQINRNPKYANLKLKAKVRKTKSIYYLLEELSGENPELVPFANYFWKVKRKDWYNFRKIMRGSTFEDIRIYPLGESYRSFSLELKRGGKLQRIHAKLYTENKKLVSGIKAKALYENYEALLLKRATDFAEQDTISYGDFQMVWECTKLLLPKNIEDDSLKLEAMQFALPPFPWYNEAMKSSIFPIGYNFLLKYSPLFEKELTQTPQPNWQQLIDNYSAGVYTTLSDKFITVPAALGQPRPSFRLYGMGIFNLDVLKSFEEKEKLLASFKNKAGEKIKFKKIEVINHNLNGLLSFDSPKIYLDIKSPTTLLVHSKGKKVHYISARELAKLPLKNKRSYEFELEEVKDYNGDPEVLRRLLSSD